MARADLLVSLVKAVSQGDKVMYRRVLEAIIAEERAKNHHILADRLAQWLVVPNFQPEPVSKLDSGYENLLYEIYPRKSFEDLILPHWALEVCQEMVEEQYRSDLLRAHNIQPRHRVLLSGPPGNGKTSLAEALAHALMYPFFRVRYEGIIGSYLGETAANLKKVFDFARSRQCVLFFDEFDSIGKERGDVHETGEIKRVVSSLLLQLDDLPSYVVVVVATNHAELLDRAVWRRFQLRLSLPMPSRRQLELWFSRFQERVGVHLGYSPRTLANKLLGVSFSEAEEFALDILRRIVLSGSGTDPKEIVSTRLRHWQERAVPRETVEE